MADGELESELANARCGTTKQGKHANPTSETLADAEHGRSNPAESQGRPRRQTGIFEGGGDQVAHTDSGRGVEGFKRSELRPYRIEQSPGDSRGTDAGQEQKRFFNGVGEFPLGPDDPAWEEIIKQYPELAPATCKHEPPARPQMYEVEPAVRRMADAGQVEDRVASLMALGNAVVPHQAELAFRTLASRI